jgi:hypothetical protein
MTKFRILTLILAGALSFSISGEVQAQSKKKKRILKKVKKKAQRKRNLVIEKTYKIKKGKTRTNFDFDAADIAGARKTPFGELVDTVQADRTYNFIKLRTNWRPEMERSAATLETGSGRK